MDYAKKTINKKKRKSVSSTSSNRASAARNHARSPKLNANHKVLSPMLLMVMAVALIFGTAIYYVDNLSKIIDVKKLSKKFEDLKVAKKTPEKSKPKEKKDKTDKTEVASKSPKFEFYHTLPKMSVEINNPLRRDEQSNKPVVREPLNLLASNRSQVVSATPNVAEPIIQDVPSIISKDTGTKSSENNNSGPYVLQLASFKDLKEAEELRAKLILNGFNVTIQTVKLPSGVVWHRVKSSKVDNLMLAENLHNQFKSHNIQSIIISEKG